MQDNIPAVIQVIQFIYDHIMYAELNTKSDYCQVCSFSGEIKIKGEMGHYYWECPNCGNPSPKNLDSHIYQLMSYDTTGNSLNLGGKIAYQPLVSAVCSRCGYVMLFNLKDLGIL